MQCSLSIQNLSELELLASRPQIRRWILSTLKSTVDVAEATEQPAQLSVIFMDVQEAKALNRQYREKNYATNVLTFNLGDGVSDIVICPQVVIQEAKTQKKSAFAHLAHLTVHGTLHAIGLDHEASADADRMEALEIKVLARFGITNPYSGKYDSFKAL